MAAGGAINKATAITASDSTVTEPGVLFVVNCTVAGNVVVRLGDGASTHTIAVETGYSAFPYAVRGVNTTNTTATATYANLYSI